LFFLFLQSLFFCGKTEAQETDVFPVIKKLDSRDTVFKQYLADVEAARRRLFGQNQSKEELSGFLSIYSYTPKEDEDIFRLSARCNVPYAALATLNRANHPDMLTGPVLLPTVPGLFIPETPSNDLERLISMSREMEEGVVITVPSKGRPVRFLFFPGADLNPTERSFFLNRGFRFPLRSYRISSPFGMRPNPFTGKQQKHNGVDLAAPIGTEVYPAREGKITEMGNDPVFGNYIVIAHDDNWASLYGHLSVFSAKSGSFVTVNTVIGKVGNTGQSTGPHLHFELRKNGAALDPTRLLFR
jgi:murein DD-endopeptidase MepM/ murein hydrolase activator NlpD